MMPLSIELTSYLYSEDKPQLTIEIGDQNQTSYAIDLYEEVDPIQYGRKMSLGWKEWFTTIPIGCCLGQRPSHCDWLIHREQCSKRLTLNH